jgi:hypothetical protein
VRTVAIPSLAMTESAVLASTVVDSVLRPTRVGQSLQGVPTAFRVGYLPRGLGRRGHATTADVERLTEASPPGTVVPTQRRSRPLRHGSDDSANRITIQHRGRGMEHVTPPASAPSETVLDEKLVGDIVGEYSVPAYQRGYRWGKGEVKQLLDDLLASVGPSIACNR